MNKVFAFLAEPASYTVDRNLKVYGPMGIDYCYINSVSEAKKTGEEETKDVLASMSRWRQMCYICCTLKKYDKIIYNGYTDIFFVMLFILNLWYCKVIGIDSDTQYREPQNILVRWFKRIYLNVIFSNKYIYGLAGGNYTHKDLFRKFGMDEERVMLMPMMVDNEHFDNPEFLQKTMRPFRFVYVGRLIECKNLYFMIRAFLLHHKTHTNSELHIVGKGALETNLKKDFSSYDGVFFDGPKYSDDLLKVYQQNNVLILPSTYEPWGLVVNEAMSAGLPVLVSSEVGAHYDLVTGHDTGIVFNNDENTLVDAMNAIVEPSLYMKLAKNAHRLMHEYWNYELYKKCLCNFIQK